MKTYNTIMAGIIWAAGFIVGIVLGKASFLLMLAYWVGAFIAGSTYFTFARILQNQDEIRKELVKSKDRVSELQKKLETPEDKGETAAKNSEDGPPSFYTQRSPSGGWKCKKCGFENPQSSAFCKNCGEYR